MNVNNMKCYHVTKHISHSIELMDEFTNDDHPYEVMILHDWFRTYSKTEEFDLSVSLCVFEENKSQKLCQDDITMTRLRKLKGHGLNLSRYQDIVPFGIYPSVTQTLTQCDPSLFGTEELIPLEYAVNLRAQTSWNRMGYGWEWDWSDGIGDCVEGTFYGETTDFYITHILVKRVPRIKSWEEIRQEKIIYYQNEIESIIGSINAVWSSERLINTKVIHRSEGNGIILAVTSSKESANINVLFGSGKNMLLSLKVAIEKGILIIENASLQEESEALCVKINALIDLRKKVKEWKDAGDEILYKLIYKNE